MAENKITEEGAKAAINSLETLRSTLCKVEEFRDALEIENLEGMRCGQGPSITVRKSRDRHVDIPIPYEVAMKFTLSEVKGINDRIKVLESNFKQS